MATRQADEPANRPSPEEWDDLCRDIGALWAAIDDITAARGPIGQSHDSLLTEFGELAQRVLRLEQEKPQAETAPGWFDKLTGKN